MDKFTEMLQRFAKIREEQGEAAFEAAVSEYANKAIESGDTSFIPGMTDAAFGEFQKAQEAYRAAQEEAKPQREAVAENMKNARRTEAEMDQGFLRVIQKSIPAMKSQAQFNAFMASFEALRGVMNAIFARDEKTERELLDALAKSIDAARKMTDITERLREVPEAAESKLADEFKNPPRQFGEYDLQRGLLSELAQVDSLEALQRWWAENRRRIDDVVSPSLRNPLIDAVRAKKEALNQSSSGD